MFKDLKKFICEFFKQCHKCWSQKVFLDTMLCQEIEKILFFILKPVEKETIVSCLIIIGELIALNNPDLYMKYLKNN